VLSASCTRNKCVGVSERTAEIQLNPLIGVLADDADDDDNDDDLALRAGEAERPRASMIQRQTTFREKNGLFLFDPHRS
jgi:hypothetical protein